VVHVKYFIYLCDYSISLEVDIILVTPTPTGGRTAHTKYVTYTSQLESVRLTYMTEVTSKQAEKNKRIATKKIKKLSARSHDSTSFRSSIWTFQPEIIK
jgi:hypothetical protein